MFWDGRQIGSTVVRRKTLNPVWVSEPGKGASSTVSRAEKTAAGEGNKKPSFWLRNVCSSNPRLRVEVFDWDALGSHDFLGGVELDVEEVAELQRATLAKATTGRVMSGGEDDKVYVVSGWLYLCPKRSVAMVGSKLHQTKY